MSFAQDLKRFAEKTKDQQTAIMRQSTQELIGIAQTPVSKGGNMPVDESFLRNSLVTELDGVRIAEGPDSYIIGINLMDAGDTMRFGWAADYARVRHYKPPSFGQGGGMWRDIAAAQWQTIVSRNINKVKT